MPRYLGRRNRAAKRRVLAVQEYFTLAWKAPRFIAAHPLCAQDLVQQMDEIGVKGLGIARGMANDPRITLYVEPTSGSDPLTTGTITRPILKLQRELGVTTAVGSRD